MHNLVLEEARQLHNVSDRLIELAEHNPLISKELIVISGNIRNAATLLEVLIATKSGPPASA